MKPHFGRGSDCRGCRPGQRPVMVEMIEDRMDYESRFRQHLEALHAEGRYRVFADLKRRCGAYPRPITSAGMR